MDKITSFGIRKADVGINRLECVSGNVIVPFEFLEIFPFLSIGRVPYPYLGLSKRFDRINLFLPPIVIKPDHQHHRAQFMRRPQGRDDASDAGLEHSRRKGDKFIRQVCAGDTGFTRGQDRQSLAFKMKIQQVFQCDQFIAVITLSPHVSSSYWCNLFGGNIGASQYTLIRV